jgi:15-cis-phytoene synthase
VVNERLVELMKFQIARARRLYLIGAEGVCWLAGDGSRFTASFIAVAHASVLRTIERRQYDVFSRTPRDARALQLTALPRAWKLAGRRHDEPLPPVF